VVETQRTPNARSRRTRQRLREAVLALGERMDFAAMSVGDIVGQAKLNRSTFYLHYPDKETLIEETLAELLAAATESGRMLRLTEDPRAARFRADWQDSLFREIATRPGLFRRLLGDTGRETFGARLMRAHEEGLSDLWVRIGDPGAASGPPVPVRARYVAAGLQGIILQWLETGMKEDPETISAWVWELIFPGPSGA
jgi:AcrR family transcriptional regulator